jgi:hypothetical protein
VSEQPVFWLGGKPGGTKNKSRENPEAARYEPAIRDACDACGYNLDEFIAAQGGFGGWLAHLENQGNRYRLFWSGKDSHMKFEQALDHGGWSELASAEAADNGLPSFIEAIKEILAAKPVAG